MHKKVIFNFLDEVLGKQTNGIFINQGYLDYDDDPTIYTNLDLKTKINHIKSIEIHNGVTKVCLTSKNLSYVVKLLFNGTYDDDNLKLIYSVNPETNAITEEEFFYKKASSNLKKVLLPNIYLGRWNNIKVYIQKKVFSTYKGRETTFLKDTLPSCSTSQNFISDRIASINSQTFSSHDLTSRLCDGFAYDVISYYGLDFAKKIFAEINELYMDDLHSNNVGYLKNGQPCIFDYGGYDEGLFWV